MPAPILQPLDPGQAGPPNLVDEFKTPGGTPGFDPNSTARDAAAVASDQARQFKNAHQPFDVTSVIGKPPGSADDTGRFGNSFFSEEHNDALQPHVDAYKKAKEYYDLADHLTSMHQATQMHLDTGDFLHENAKLDPTSPTYERDHANLLAQFPNADPTKVTEASAGNHAARALYLEAMKHGGASEFGSVDNPTPAYHAYMNTTGTPIEKRAAALLTQQGEKDLDEGRKQNAFSTEEHLPAWNTDKDGNPDPNADWSNPQSKDRPKIYNADGTLNYEEGRKIIAANLGVAAGKVTKAEEVARKTDLADAWKLLNSRAKDKKNPLNTENAPNRQSGYDPNNAQHVAHDRAWWRAYKIATGQDPNAPEPDGSAPPEHLEAHPALPGKTSSGSKYFQ